MSRLLALSEVAERLGGVSVRTVQREIGEGHLRDIKIRGRTLVEESEVDAYIAHRAGRRPRAA